MASELAVSYLASLDTMAGGVGDVAHELAKVLRVTNYRAPSPFSLTETPVKECPGFSYPCLSQFASS